MTVPDQFAESVAPENRCPGWSVTPEELAECFHVALHGYKTREASAVPWTEVPAQNKALMIDVAERVLRTWFPAHIDGSEGQ